MTTIKTTQEGMAKAVQDELKKRIKEYTTGVEKVLKELGGNSQTLTLGDVSVDSNSLDAAITGVREYLNRLDDLDFQSMIQPLNDAINRSLVANGLVDTGQLKNSLTIQVVGEQLLVEYDCPYAGILHEGGYVQPYGNANAKKVYIPPRPWIINTLDNFDFQPLIEEVIARALGN